MSRRKGGLEGSVSNLDAGQLWSKLAGCLGLTKYKFSPFSSWEELQSARVSSGFEREVSNSSVDVPTRLSIALACLDVLHIYCLAYSIVVLRNNVESKGKSPKMQASFSLLSGMAADIAAIGLLCRKGLDIQSKVIVRSFREKLDALLYAHLNRAFAVSYVKVDGDEEANKFWHNWMSKGKLIKSISKSLGRHSVSGQSPIDQDWIERRRKQERWLGQAVHPSHTTGFLSASPNFGDDQVSDNVGVFGDPSDNSLTTIQTVFDFSFELLILARSRIPLRQTEADPAAPSELLTIERVLKNSEDFLYRCHGASKFAPNLELLKLIMYLEGRVILEKDSEYNVTDYEVEVAQTALRILEAAKLRIEQKLCEAGRDLKV